MIANKNALKDEWKREKIKDLKVLLMGVIEASKKLHIFMNVKEDNLNQILTELPALKRPTISKLAGDDSDGWFAINTIIKKDEFLNLIPILRKYLDGLDDNDYLFPTYKGHIVERTVQEVLKNGKRKAGIKRKFTSHDLRHSFAINCLDKGIDIEEVRKMLGHARLDTTQIYLQCKRTKLKEIALKLERNITQYG